MNQLTCLPNEAVLWGEHILEDCVARLSDFGVSRPIAFSVEPLVQLYAQRVQPHLKDAVGSFTELPAHVPDFAVEGGLDACLQTGAESIVAMGGGSVLDAAKAVSYMHHRRTGRYLPIAALPTTLSGSEFSHYFGITETKGQGKFKRSHAVRETTPKVVLLDPVLLLDTPRPLLLSSAVKGMDHAVEGMRHVTPEHPHAIMAASGVQRFMQTLRRWPRDISTREALEQGHIRLDDILQLQLAAWHCYFSPASVAYGLSHRIGHILGGTFGLPHSATSCITLAPVIRACAGFYGDKLEIFGMRPEQGRDAEDLADKIAAVVTSLGLPDKIGAFGLDKEKLGEVAELLEKNYPIEVADLGDDSSARLKVLLKSIW